MINDSRTGHIAQDKSFTRPDGNTISVTAQIPVGAALPLSFKILPVNEIID